MRLSWMANAPKASRQRNPTGPAPSTDRLIGRSQSPAVSPLPSAAYRSMRARRCSTPRVIRSEDSTPPATLSVCFSTTIHRVRVRHAMSSFHVWPDGTLRPRDYNFFGEADLALFFAILVVLMGSRSWVAAQEAKPFYEGKTIQLLVSSGPGATTDISARLVGRYLGKHIPGNPGMIVQNMPGGGGLVGANYLYNVAKPDGLTILAVSRANYLDQMVGRPEVKTDFRKFSWIGSFNKAPMMAACRTDTPYKSIAAIRAAKVPPRFGQSGTGSISYVFGSLIEKILDLKLKNVTGFKSGRDTDLGLERGEVDCRATSDITVIRAPWNLWVKENLVTFI